MGITANIVVSERELWKDGMHLNEIGNELPHMGIVGKESNSPEKISRISQDLGNYNLAENDMPEDFNVHSAINGNITSKPPNETINDELRDPLFAMKNVWLSNADRAEIV